MSRTPHHRKVLAIIALGWAIGSSGCIHNHYYGTAIPGCPPAGQTVTTQLGSVCDVPSNGNVVVSGATSSRAISSNVAPQSASAGNGVSTMSPDRVVISQPAYGPPSIGQFSNRMKSPWRKPDPDPAPVLKAEGAYDDSTIR